ncbi:uncharacterized protein KY384_008617 [Bacidia gigantensis]|uniref:uncharacterized protein n=1 Tax=Bacidia gigantensis TaxID=2732470 RepID=UPI001D050AD1|nr:uncharacterized protein KY384_008617 [Bacidia gigantensis]KAG8527187.1 hypothetical protein KY384_008617 [Bacidia gigantensis]
MADAFSLANHDFADASIVRLEVGSADAIKSLFVHEAVVCAVSPVLKAAFQGNFRESQQKVCTLEDTDLATANALVQWLYTRKTFCLDTKEGKDAQTYYLETARLYVCACKYMISSLIESLEHDIAHAPYDVPYADSVSLVYKNTPPSSGLRKIYTACYASHTALDEWFGSDSCMELFASCPDFAADLAIAFARRLKDPNKACHLHQLLGMTTCVKPFI